MKNLPAGVFSLDDLEDDLVTGSPGPGGVDASLDDQATVTTSRDDRPTAGPHRFVERFLKIVKIAT
jgi:hypothetical protein